MFLVNLQVIRDTDPDRKRLSEQGNLCHHIGAIKVDEGDYREAITYFEKNVGYL